MVETVRERAAYYGAAGPVRRVSWGAIIAGALLALTIQFMLGLLGLGIGLSTIDPAQTNETPSANALLTTSGLWTIAIVLIGLFIGAFAAGRLAGSASKTDGALHGIVTWATSTLLIVYILSSGASAVVGGTFGAIGSSIQGISQAAGSIIPTSTDQLPPGLQQQAEQLFRQGQSQAQQAAGQVQGEAQQAAQTAQAATGEQDLSDAIPEVLAGLQADATPEQRQAAVQVIAQTANIPQPEAEQRLAEFQQRYDQAVADLRQAADRAASALSTGAFGAFVALLLGLIVGAIGGVVGRPKTVPVATARATV